jgi:hypothetical protein
MTKKKILISFIVLISLFMGVLPVFGQNLAVPSAPNAIARTLRGMTITIGNWWADYNLNAVPPTSQWIGSDSQERQLDYRKRLTQQYNFTMRERGIATWSDMPQRATASIMAGRPAASVFVLQPNWALALHRQNLLYPVSTRRAINWTATTPVEWNRTVTEAFTFGTGSSAKAYAFAAGYGTADHAAVVFFNKRLFREAGLDPNLPYDLQRSGEWTWDRFLDICKRLTRDVNNDGRIDFYAMPRDLSTEILDSFVASNGAVYVDRDRRTGRLVNATNRPEFIEAVQFFMRLRDEGVMMDRPDGSEWDWHKPAFIDGKVAMFFDQQYYAQNELRNMRDDWGMVLPPKGPRASNYIVFNDESVYIVPANGFTDAEVDAILWAVQAWITPVDADWRVSQYPYYRDRRAVDETIAMIRDQRLWQWRYHLHVPGLERGHIAWEIWFHGGEPAQLIEAVSQNWNALIADANSAMR